MGYSPVNSEELSKWFTLAKTGDETALSRLIELTQDHLYRFCFYVSGNAQRSEDLCQETFIKAFANLSTIDDPSKFMGWLFRVAKNLFIDHTRSKKSKEISIEKPDGTWEIEEPSSSDQDTTLMVRSCLKQLTEEERMVIVLVDSEGYTYEEAAQIIGITEEAIKSRLHRARKAFLEIFNKS